MNSLSNGSPASHSSRRRFLRHATGFAAALSLSPRDAAAFDTWVEAQRVSQAADPRPDGAVAADEAYWARVRQAYDLHPTVINFDHGWTNPAPRDAMAWLERYAKELEALPAEMLLQLWETFSTTTLRDALAGAMAVPPGEIALVRNATEALDTVLLGVPLRTGDEVVCSVHDYYAMLDALHQRRDRDGVVLRIVEPPVPAPSMEALEQAYAAALGPKTRLVLLTHPSNLTGQLLPVRRIAERARALGAERVVDGAQSLGVLEDPVRSLGCDYYGASAHKWLGTPVGLGVLWMRPAHVAKVWPLFPPGSNARGMGRFEWIGTTPEYLNPGALPALALHKTIGAVRKGARLRYLGTYWRTRLAAAIPEARFYSNDADGMTTGLCTVELPDADHPPIQKRLFERDRILIQAMSGARAPEIRGIRVTPNVYTTPAELDRFVAALAAASKEVSAPAR